MALFFPLLHKVIFRPKTLPLRPPFECPLVVNSPSKIFNQFWGGLIFVLFLDQPGLKNAYFFRFPKTLKNFPSALCTMWIFGFLLDQSRRGLILWGSHFGGGSYLGGLLPSIVVVVGVVVLHCDKQCKLNYLKRLINQAR